MTNDNGAPPGDCKIPGHVGGWPACKTCEDVRVAEVTGVQMAQRTNELLARSAVTLEATGNVTAAAKVAAQVASFCTNCGSTGHLAAGCIHPTHDTNGNAIPALDACGQCGRRVRDGKCNQCATGASGGERPRFVMPTPEVADPEGVAEGRYGPRPNGKTPALSDSGPDPAAFIVKAHGLLGPYVGKTPIVPPMDVVENIFDLLHLALNPTGEANRARSALFPDYPTKWLPAPMAAQLAAAGSLAPGGFGAAMLGCGSAACMGSRLLIDDTRRVVPTLWVPSIGDSGSGKTPAADLVWEPYLAREDREAMRYAAEMQEWASLDRKEKQTRPKPINNTAIGNDATMEAVARRLKGGIEAFALVADELGVILNGLGQYKKGGGSDKDRALSFWSGKPWTYERVGNGDDGIFIHVSNPVVPIFGTIQPERTPLLGDVGSGMQARWLPHWVPRRAGTDTGRTAHEWEAAIRVLLNDLYRSRTWTMPRDSEARREHLLAEERWSVEAGEMHQTAASTSFLAKGGEHSARIALVLAEISAAGDAAARGHGRVAEGQIPLWAVRAAVDIVDYCAAVWRALPNVEAPLSRSWAEARVAEKDGQLNAWLRNHGGQATKREIQAAKVAGARTPAAVQALIDRHKEIYGEDAIALGQRGQIVVYAR